MRKILFWREETLKWRRGKFFNQSDGSEVLRIIRTSSLLSHAPTSVYYDLDLLQLTKVAICKLQPRPSAIVVNFLLP